MGLFSRPFNLSSISLTLLWNLISRSIGGVVVGGCISGVGGGGSNPNGIGGCVDGCDGVVDGPTKDPGGPGSAK